MSSLLYMSKSSALPLYKLFMRFFVAGGGFTLRSTWETHKERRMCIFEFGFGQILECCSISALLICRYTQKTAYTQFSTACNAPDAIHSLWRSTIIFIGVHGEGSMAG